MTNEQALKNMNKIEDILIHTFGGYPYTEEEEVLLMSLDKAVEALRKQLEYDYDCSPMGGFHN